jgi:diphosphomevalonate decarboxylase
MIENKVRLHRIKYKLGKSMSSLTATAIAHPNIAFIKYWGNRDDSLRLPSNGSISMNLDGLKTQTCVEFDANLSKDILFINNEPIHGLALERVNQFLDLVRQKAGKRLYANIESENSFPTGVGVASSASAFAALALAGSQALKVNATEKELSCLARRGSGSACRSIPNGFVEWQAGKNDDDSFAFSIADPDYWGIIDCIAIIKTNPKKMGSTEGHQLAVTSPLQDARIQDSPRRLDICREAIIQKDFTQFADIVELDSNLMHAVMMTSTPALFYWETASYTIMRMVQECRSQGMPVCYTLDAGPNVHVLCLSSAAEEIKKKLLQVEEVQQVLTAKPGSGAQLITQ